MDSKRNDGIEDAKVSESRKKDHIELAFRSAQDREAIDQRFYYEPLLSSHPNPLNTDEDLSFAGKSLKVPIWVSSMTGGTELAERINHNLCRACREFGMGFGLGSCRPLLEGNKSRWKDFAFRDVIGDEQPFYANLGIAQLEPFAGSDKWDRVVELVHNLKADGLIIHVNPLQEALQPEGDRFNLSSLDVIKAAVEETELRIIVKEVGQGFGPESLRELLRLPLQAVEFAAHGGTNFSKLELMRSDEQKMNTFAPLSMVGHTADEMVEFTNTLKEKLDDEIKVNQLIISGGVRNYLDGYYLINKSVFSAVYGQASGFLRHATGDYEQLHSYVKSQIKGYFLAKAFLRIK
ncbi:MAG: isopentenyl-diphosphate delta-isomerase [Saprospirales bacterium]|nr:MAG: isopentenyl-diphosphate delta-isomerase [Saprospirales bacterium]